MLEMVYFVRWKKGVSSGHLQELRKPKAVKYSSLSLSVYRQTFPETVLKLYTSLERFFYSKFVMVYGIENHGIPYQSSTANCIPRDGFNGLSCENFNSANIPAHSQISTTTQNGRKRGSIVASGGGNIDLTGLSREERRRESMNTFFKWIFTNVLFRKKASDCEIPNCSCDPRENSRRSVQRSIFRAEKTSADFAAW